MNELISATGRGALTKAPFVNLNRVLYSTLVIRKINALSGIDAEKLSDWANDLFTSRHDRRALALEITLRGYAVRDYDRYSITISKFNLEGDYSLSTYAIIAIMSQRDRIELTAAQQFEFDHTYAEALYLGPVCQDFEFAFSEYVIEKVEAGLLQDIDLIEVSKYAANLTEDKCTEIAIVDGIRDTDVCAWEYYNGVLIFCAYVPEGAESAKLAVLDIVPRPELIDGKKPMRP